MKESQTPLKIGETGNGKGKCWEEQKGSERKGRERGNGKWGKGRGKWINFEEKEKNEEKKKAEKGVVEVAKGKEEWRGKPYRAVEEDGFWWAPISNDEWAEWREKETFRCKEGGWWTKMPDERYEVWQFMRDRRG